MYIASEVDSEIAILTQSRDFWKKKCEEFQKEIENLSIYNSKSKKDSHNSFEKDMTDVHNKIVYGTAPPEK